MGATGSGPRYGYAEQKPCIEDQLSLNISYLVRGKALVHGRHYSLRLFQDDHLLAEIDILVGQDHLILSGADLGSTQQTVRIAHTTCTFGGTRPWFICPTPDCNRRVAILYLKSGFACRKCLKLAYACERKSPADRAAQRCEKIRARLGWEPGLWSDPGPRPEGMPLKTFERLVKTHDRLAMIFARRYFDHLFDHRAGEES